MLFGVPIISSDKDAEDPTIYASCTTSPNSRCPKWAGSKEKQPRAASRRFLSEYQRDTRLIRERPGAGYRHLLTIDDVRLFVSLIPNWDELSIGLDAILLSAGDWDRNGWHQAGVVAICAWERELWVETMEEHVDGHRGILDRLGVPRETIHDESGKAWVVCKWTVEAARAYQLLHILLHELGHHYDR